MTDRLVHVLKLFYEERSRKKGLNWASLFYRWTSYFILEGVIFIFRPVILSLRELILFLGQLILSLGRLILSLGQVILSLSQLIFSPIFQLRTQSIHGLFGGTTQSGRKLLKLKLEQEIIKDASLSLRKSLKSCLHYPFHVS